MSSAAIERDTSTASSRRRPSVGTGWVSPNHCGRIAAATSNSHTRASNSSRRRGLLRAATAGSPATLAANGKNKAAPCGRDAGSRRDSSHGKGSSSNIHGQAR